MKKSCLLALLLSGVATAATAQSEMRIAGRLDVGYGISNGGDFAGKGRNDGKFQQWSSGKSPSYWSLRGSEQVNENLKAFFQLEGGVNLESGTSNGFNRDAYVGLSGSFGQVRFGRQKSALNYAMGKYDLAGRPNLTSSVNMAGVTAQTPKHRNSTLGRFDSALIYMSPKVYNFQLTAGFILENDDALNMNDNARNIYEFALEYRRDNFDIALAYRSKPYSGSDQAWGISARYNFGKFIVAGGFFDNHLDDDGKGYFLGVRAPIGSWRIGAQVAYNTDAVRGGQEIKPLAWETFAYYDLSKTTHLYLIYGGLNNDAQTYQRASRDYSVAAGIVHLF